MLFEGPERFDEAMAYVEQHQLYDAALSIWKSTDQYNVSTCNHPLVTAEHLILVFLDRPQHIR